MGNFTFYAPTRVYFGRKEEEQIGSILKQEGCHRVLVHYGGQSAVKSGLLDRVLASLKKAGISAVTLGGVVPNPQLSKVREGIALAKKEQVDFILAVGGGSVIDSAKGIGYGVVNEGDVWEYYARRKKVTGCLPVGAILTIAAAGSEMSNSSVITNEDGWLKRGLSSDYGRCRFAIMNPELTMTLPPYQTASGCTDIILHTMERYFIKENNMDITDGFAESLMRTVMKHTRILMKEPNNYESRAEVMWAGSLSHNDITGSRSFGDWACHQLEHELSGMYKVAHGAGLAAVWGSWARYVYQEQPSRFAQYARNVMGIREENDVECALAGIEATEQFFKEIGMPTSIHEMGITLCEEDIRKLAWKCSFEDERTIGCFKVLKKEDMENIYRIAKYHKTITLYKMLWFYI